MNYFINVDTGELNSESEIESDPLWWYEDDDDREVYWEEMSFRKFGNATAWDMLEPTEYELFLLEE